MAEVQFIWIMSNALEMKAIFWNVQEAVNPITAHIMKILELIAWLRMDAQLINSGELKKVAIVLINSQVAFFRVSTLPEKNTAINVLIITGTLEMEDALRNRNSLIAAKKNTLERNAQDAAIILILQQLACVHFGCNAKTVRGRSMTQNVSHAKELTVRNALLAKNFVLNA